MNQKVIIYLISFLLPFSVLAQGKKKDTFKVVTLSKPVKIVIDPGHGGYEIGREASSSQRKHEKDLNLDIALRLGGYLSERVKNIEVLYTRKTDRYVSLDERVDLANESEVDYFISVHCNSHPKNRKYVGTQCHIQTRKFKNSLTLAQRIEKEFSSRAGRTSRGVKDHNDRGHNLQVIQYTNMSSVLVECGFMSNEGEEKFLNSGRGQDIIASAIFRGIRDHILENPNPVSENRDSYYKVQFLSSVKPLDPEKNNGFSKLGMRVEREELQGATNQYKYRYVVGREYEKKWADKLLKKVQSRGYKDAFLVAYNNNPQEKDSLDELKIEHFRVQIMSTKEKIKTTTSSFKKLKEDVVVIENEETSNPYKYQYMVGFFLTRKEAKILMEKVRKQGFPDAFIVRFSGEDKKKKTASNVSTQEINTTSSKK